MAVYFENYEDVDLVQRDVKRSFLSHSIGEGDSGANRFGVRVYRDRETASLTGAECVGYFVRSDGVTLVISGTVSGNEAYIELPAAAYAVEGNFTLAIKLSGTGYAGTVRIVDGVVVNTTTKAISDPSSVVPDLETLTAIIERAEDAVEVIDGLTITASVISGTRYCIDITKE